jgi:hypothetical protein
MVQEVIVVPKEELEDGIAPASSTSNGDGSDTSTVVVGFEYLTPGNTLTALQRALVSALQLLVVSYFCACLSLYSTTAGVTVPLDAAGFQCHRLLHSVSYNLQPDQCSWTYEVDQWTCAGPNLCISLGLCYRQLAVCSLW